MLDDKVVLFCCEIFRSRSWTWSMVYGNSLRNSVCVYLFHNEIQDKPFDRDDLIEEKSTCASAANCFERCNVKAKKLTLLKMA